MDYMRQGIGLQGYAQKNPKNEYKIQSFNLFTKMLDNLKYQVVRTLSRIQVRMPELSEEQIAQLKRMQEEKEKNLSRPKKATLTDGHDHVGRNDPCPCGSGKKYKDCCGKL